MCRTDADCVNSCDLTTGRCYSRIAPALEMPIKFIPRFIILAILLSLILATLLISQRDLLYKGYEYLKERAGIVKEAKTRRRRERLVRKVRETKMEEEERIMMRRLKAARARRRELGRIEEKEGEEKRKAAIKGIKEKIAKLEKERKGLLEAARKEPNAEVRKLEEERALKLEQEIISEEEKLKRIEETEKAAEIRARKEAEELEEFVKKKEEYASILSKFFVKSIHKGYSHEKIRDMLIAKGWPESIVTEYCDEFFESKKRLVSEIKKEAAGIEIRSREETMRLIKEVKEKERLAKRRLRKLEDKLLQIDKRMYRK
jgi:hypothetical protein